MARPVFGDSSSLDDHDLIGGSDGLQPMSDYDNCPPREQPLGCGRQEGLGGRIQPRRRLVEDDNPGILQEDTGEGQKLLLAGREPLSRRADLTVESETANLIPKAR